MTRRILRRVGLVALSLLVVGTVLFVHPWHWGTRGIAHAAGPYYVGANTIGSACNDAVWYITYYYSDTENGPRQYSTSEEYNYVGRGDYTDPSKVGWYFYYQHIYWNFDTNSWSPPDPNNVPTFACPASLYSPSRSTEAPGYVNPLPQPPAPTPDTPTPADTPTDVPTDTPTDTPTYDCGNGVTLTQDDVANLGPVFGAFGAAFDPSDPCTSWNAAAGQDVTTGMVFDVADATNSVQDTGSDVAGIPGETCYLSTKDIPVTNNAGTTSLATITGGFNYCSGGNQVYGKGPKGGDPSLEPSFVGTVIGAKPFFGTTLIQVGCGEATNGALSISGKGYLDYKGSPNGGYFTLATTLCNVYVGLKSGLTLFNHFDVTFQTEAYYDSGGAVVVYQK